MADLNTLARQLVEHPRWTWKPGMGVARSSGEPVGVYVHPHGHYSAAVHNGKVWHIVENPLPDLGHPATMGWLLHMLLLVAEQVHFETAPHGGAEVYVKWRDSAGDTHRAWFRDDGALAAALLAVWGAS